jgi:hypothetical protein
MMTEENIELRWHDLKTEAIPGNDCVVLFPQISDVGILYGLENIYTPSNPEFARLNALRQGYTSWFPIPRHPKEDEIKEYIKKLYADENDGQEQFYEGFQRATENIIEFLKEIVPDRPNVILAVEARFGEKENNK